MCVNTNYTGIFIKNQHKDGKLTQLFTRAYRNKNAERKKIIRHDVVYTSEHKRKTNKKTHTV